MVGVASYFYRMTFKVFTNAAEVAVKFVLIGRVNECFTVLSAEHYVEVVFYERLSHDIYITPLRGLVLAYVLPYRRAEVPVVSILRPFGAQLLVCLLNDGL